MSLFEKVFVDPPMERVLFNVFVSIFILTALVTLGGVANFIPVQGLYLDKLFVALILEVVGGIVALFSITFLTWRGAGKQDHAAARASAFHLSLEFRGKRPEEVEIAEPGDYWVWDPTRRETVKEGLGEIQAWPGQGGWECQLPEDIGVDQQVRLLFREPTREEWVVGPFSPRFNRQVARPNRALSASAGM